MNKKKIARAWAWFKQNSVPVDMVECNDGLRLFLKSSEFPIEISKREVKYRADELLVSHKEYLRTLSHGEVEKIRRCVDCGYICKASTKNGECPSCGSDNLCISRGHRIEIDPLTENAILTDWCERFGWELKIFDTDKVSGLVWGETYTERCPFPIRLSDIL
jgi:predicted Zn-ribbon and HTH transcriptional regulator